MSRMLTIVILLNLTLASCTKEDNITVLQSNGSNTYTLDNLIGNVRITIYNTPNSYDITVINGPGSVVGSAIRNQASPSTVYFSDSYIPKSGSETQSSSASGLPKGENLELKIVVYSSTVSSAVYRSIELLGLDFWTAINDYKESIAEEHIKVFRLGN